jgi:hypothetical protein
MSITSKLKHKIHASGVRGALASGLHHAASRIDSGDETNHVNEFLAWVRFAIPGMLAPGNMDAMEYALTNMPPGKPIAEIGRWSRSATFSSMTLAMILTGR